MNNLHNSIEEQLNSFLIQKKIPNIIFYGKPGSGKKTVVFEFIQKIYKYNKEHIKFYVMNVDCAIGNVKGIKFIREELKTFAKTNIFSDNGNFFKTILLLNADYLTDDAQSALRRCIELFSKTTRFFIVAENKFNLMNPILSRFCDIYFEEPYINGIKTNLNLHKINTSIIPNNDLKLDFIKKELCLIENLYSKNNNKNDKVLFEFSNKMYEKGYSAINLIETIKSIVQQNYFLSKLLFDFNEIKKNIRSEKILLLWILSNYFNYKINYKNQK